MKFVFGAGLLTLLLTVASFLFTSDERVFNGDPFPSRLIRKAELYSNHFRADTRENWTSMAIGTAPAGTAVSVMEEGPSQWYKIQLPDGTMGWVEESALQPSDGGLIRSPQHRSVHLWDSLDKAGRTIVAEVPGRDWVTRIDHAGARHGSGGTEVTYSRVRTADGAVGWVYDWDVERIGWKQPRLIDRREWRFNKAGFVADWTGKPIAAFLDAFAEAAARVRRNGADVYYFNNIFLYDGDRKEMGIQAVTRDGVIESFERSGRITKWIGLFPLSETLRMPVIMNGIWDILDLGANHSYDAFGDRTAAIDLDLPTWASVAIAVLFAGFYLAMIYLILFVPFWVSNGIAWRISQNRNLANGVILTIAAATGLVLSYLYFVFTNVNIGLFNNWFVLHVLFVVGMTLGFLGKWRGDLMYRRCAQCRYWSGTDNGSDLLSRTHQTLTTTYNTGRKTVDKGTQEVWVDHRLCENPQCGNRWDVIRTFFTGWSRA